MTKKNKKKSPKIKIDSNTKLYSGLITAKESLRFLVYLPELDKEVEATPFGNLFKRQATVVVGDKIEGFFESEKFFFKSVKPRKNSLIRPRIANVDFVAITTCYKEPDLTLFQLDKMITIYLYYNTTPILIFNKIDLLNDEEMENLLFIKNYYEKIGIKSILISALNDNLTEKLSEILHSGILIFAGPSGTGKSTILNSLTGLNQITDEISHKSKRGRNTTVDSKLVKVNDFFIGDTPGFSELYPHMIITEEVEVKKYFKEMENPTCKYANCNHLNEPDCSVKQKLEDGEMADSRYNSYELIFEDIKQNARKW